MEVDNPSYSDEEILKFLASKLPPDVLGAVTEFCAVELEESEYDILAKHPDLLHEYCIDAVRQVAIRANNRKDDITAFRFHRKTTILECCVEQGGPIGFLRLLEDSRTASEFFCRVGPPPGYREDFYEKLADVYFSGDNLEDAAQKQGSEDRSAIIFECPGLISMDSEASWLLDKYAPSFHNQSATDASSSNSLGVSILSDKVDEAIISQFQHRRQLIHDFVHRHAAMKKFLNWFLSMLKVNRIKLLSACANEFIHKSFILNEVINARQRELLVPELSDANLLTKDDGQLMFELFIKGALGRENVFETPINGFEDTIISDDIAEVSETAAGPIVGDLGTQFAEVCASTTDVKVLVEWIHAKEVEYKYYVPAIIYLEWLLEETLLKNGQIEADKLKTILEQRKTLDDFERPLWRYRTRIIQLFLLGIVEKCLREIVPRSRGRVKRKRR